MGTNKDRGIQQKNINFFDFISFIPTSVNNFFALRSCDMTINVHKEAFEDIH